MNTVVKADVFIVVNTEPQDMSVAISGLRTVEIVAYAILVTLLLAPKEKAPRNDKLGCVISTGAGGGMERSVYNGFLGYVLWAALGMTVNDWVHIWFAKGRNAEKHGG